MGIADAIVDLVSSGTTLRENNLKEIEGGVILESQVITLFLVYTLKGSQLDKTEIYGEEPLTNAFSPFDFNLLL